LGVGILLGVRYGLGVSILGPNKTKGSNEQQKTTQNQTQQFKFHYVQFI